MPKKSKKPEAANPDRNRKTLWALRNMPIDFLVILSVAFASMFIRFWPLEFVASYIPQILVLMYVYLMIYASFACWYVFIHDAENFVNRVGRFRLTILAAGFLFGTFTFAISSNISTVQVESRKLTFEDSHLTIGTFNKLYKSDDFANDVALITAAQVDVISLQEVTQSEIVYIKRLINHRFSYTTDCDCSALDTEIGLVSRYPIINARTIYERENAVIARTLLRSDEHGDFVVYLVHMYVPYELDAYNKREDAMRLLSNAIDSETLPTFAIGDFNTTIYSPDMRNFISETENANNITSRSWPRCSWYGTPFGALACARIDYVFAPDSANVHSLEIGSQENSDHRSVIAEVSF